MIFQNAGNYLLAGEM